MDRKRRATNDYRMAVHLNESKFLHDIFMAIERDFFRIFFSHGNGIENAIFHS